jgi:hypothetical protein
VTLLLLLDFSKAFEHVRHFLLLKKLSVYFKFGGTGIALVGSYLAYRYQCVSVSGVLWNWLGLLGALCNVLCWGLYSSRYLSTIFLPRLTSVDFICTLTMCSSIWVMIRATLMNVFVVWKLTLVDCMSGKLSVLVCLHILQSIIFLFMFISLRFCSVSP